MRAKESEVQGHLLLLSDFKPGSYEKRITCLDDPTCYCVVWIGLKTPRGLGTTKMTKSVVERGGRKRNRTMCTMKKGGSG